MLAFLRFLPWSPSRAKLTFATTVQRWFSQTAAALHAENNSINPLENNLQLYQEVTHETLQDLLTKCETLEELDIPNFDVQEHDGVFELKLGDKGTYVINKQTPNRQMWLSSPISGPKRYNWDPESKRWRNTRDGHDLIELFSKEVSQLLNIEFSVYNR